MSRVEILPENAARDSVDGLKEDVLAEKPWNDLGVDSIELWNSLLIWRMSLLLAPMILLTIWLGS